VIALEGRRILIVEDEFLVAAMLEDFIADLGGVVIGPAATIKDAMTLAADRDIDAAVVDVNVNNERIDPVARLLRQRGVPFVLATGYGQGVASIAEGAEIIDKPYTQQRVAAALARCLASR
jgi:DNA-binding NtrC family response regulator